VLSKGVGREADEIDLIVNEAGAMDYKSLFTGRMSNGETLGFSCVDCFEKTHLIVACLRALTVSLPDATYVVFQCPLERDF